jgi:hypothetical protein
MTANDILNWYAGLTEVESLPPGVRMLHPYRNPATWEVVTAFYHQFYADSGPRHLILGINPGRLGAGTTGIPFTDPIRLQSHCGLPWNGPTSYETSSAFVYQVIDQWGGASAFYRDFFIGAVSPLGLVQTTPSGGEVNANYYDSPAIFQALLPFMQANLRWQAQHTVSKRVLLYGQGKNLAALNRMNQTLHLFQEVRAVEHPRYIMQYKAKQVPLFVNRHVEALAWLKEG